MVTRKCLENVPCRKIKAYVERHQSNLPHASTELHEATIAKGQRNDDVGNMHTSSAQIDQAEDEGSQRESGQAQGSWIGEFTAFHTLVEPWLKFTAESWTQRMSVYCVLLILAGREGCYSPGRVASALVRI